MDYIKNFLNYFRSADTKREIDDNDLSNRLSISPNDARGEHINGIISSDTRDQEITDSIFNKFFNGNRSNEDNINNIPRDHPFFGSGFMDISNVDNYLQNLMYEMERHFQGMMGFQGFSDFNTEDFQGQNFQNYPQLAGDSLRDHYLNTGEADVKPEINQQIVRMDDPKNLKPSRTNYTMQTVTYKVNQDGTAEVTQIIKDGDGREERNVTKFKLF